MNIKLLLQLLLLIFVFQVSAQPGSLDSTFSIGAGFNNSVIATTLQLDGKILVGGNLTAFNGTSANRIARLHNDGSLDTTFSTGTGMNSVVYVFCVQPDQKIVVGGWFTSYNNQTANYIIRLNPDGSVDSTFNTGTGFDYRVETIAIQQDGKILVGGDFNLYNGTSSVNIVRLNPDGSFDSTFVTGTGFSGNWTKSISIQQDGKIIVGGNYTSYNGTTANYIARLNSDGSIDPTFDTGTGFNGTVMITAIQPDGKIIAGGDFTSFNGSNINRIIRLNPDGSRDTSFDPGTGFDDRPRTISVQQNGRIVIGGTFTEFNGATAKLIARLNSDGSQDTTFQTGTGFTNTGALVSLLSSALQNDGQIIVGGTFVEYDGTTINRIAKLHGDCIVDEITDTVFACSDFTWIDGITYTSSDSSATYTLLNTEGCDSIIRLHLTIENIDTGVSQNGIHLSANQNEADYQWIDCNNMMEIPGAIAQSFTPAANGSYAVIITLNTCSDTSECFTITTIDIEENIKQKQWSVFPNPVGEYFSVQTLNDGIFELFDFSGKLIATYIFTPGSHMIREEFSHGIYFIREQKSQEFQKIIIE